MRGDTGSAVARVPGHGLDCTQAHAGLGLCIGLNHRLGNGAMPMDDMLQADCIVCTQPGRTLPRPTSASTAPPRRGLGIQGDPWALLHSLAALCRVLMLTEGVGEDAPAGGGGGGGIGGGGGAGLDLMAVHEQQEALELLR